MKLHTNNGFKAACDRAVLINSYHVMCKDFLVPKGRRLDDASIAHLSNEMLFKINKDIYSQATVKQAKRLAVKMGLLESPIHRIVRRLAAWFKPKPTIVYPKEAARAKA